LGHYGIHVPARPDDLDAILKGHDAPYPFGAKHELIRAHSDHQSVANAFGTPQKVEVADVENVEHAGCVSDGQCTLSEELVRPNESEARRFVCAAT
jgi:hypothetical protein